MSVLGDAEVNITNSARAFNCNVFDGVDDYVEIPHDVHQLGSSLSNGFTISAWINVSSRVVGRILDKSADAGSTAGFLFTVPNTSTFFELKINGSAAIISGSNSIPFKYWGHCLLTVSRNNLVNFYINTTPSGTLNQTIAQPISAITTLNAMRIGNRSAATDRPFDGGIKDVKMWNRVLTQDEIEKDYHGDVPTDGLIHYFKLGGDYHDYGSVGVDATNSGSIPAYIDDQLPTTISGALVALNIPTISGAFMMCDIAGGQILTSVIHNS